jgi:hypothetical protein
MSWLTLILTTSEDSSEDEDMVFEKFQQNVSFKRNVVRISVSQLIIYTYTYYDISAMVNIKLN